MMLTSWPYQSKHIDIIANDATISDDGKHWKPIWRHDSPLGFDKAASIQEYRTIASSESEDGSLPMIVFVGDGVSDLAAAREADVLFARRGMRLEEYCRESRIPHVSFDTFKDIQAEIVRIMKEDTKKTAGAGKPMHYNPHANFWRKAVKKKNVWISRAPYPSSPSAKATRPGPPFRQKLDKGGQDAAVARGFHRPQQPAGLVRPRPHSELVKSRTHSEQQQQQQYQQERRLAGASTGGGFGVVLMIDL